MERLWIGMICNCMYDYEEEKEKEVIEILEDMV